MMPTIAIENLLKEISIPPDGTLSRTVYRDESVKVILFGFAPGQELSEHTASVPAIMHFLDGTGAVSIEGQRYEVGPGSWFFMPPQTPHTVTATSQLTMLLTLVTSTQKP
ncbi:MAG: cupin domain-containing protein [Candidatus Sumerlaeaceae bacterium]|jgi:quercetin dioxygenase-like cupin family protein